MNTAKRLPSPHPDNAGRLLIERKGKTTFAKIASYWQPLGALFENLCCTVSRYAVELIDQTDGKAYSADALESKILAHSANRSPGTPVHAVAGTVVITGTTIAANDVVTVATNLPGASSQYYQFTSGSVVGDGTPPFEVKVGATDSDSLDNLIAAINGGAGAGTLYNALAPVHPLVTASAGAGDTVLLTAKTAGAAINAGELEHSGPGTITFSTPTFTGGIDATTANAGDQLFDENYLYTALSDIAITSTSGWGKSVIDPL